MKPARTLSVAEKNTQNTKNKDLTLTLKNEEEHDPGGSTFL